jgi:p-hydroxybenzoate 3-monooxygenase
VRTQVGIIGAGPAGLVLAHLLRLHGIDAVVLERRSRTYVEQRVRAGVLEQGTVDLLTATGVGARLQREGSVHAGTELLFSGEGHRIDFQKLTDGRTITLYGQQEVVKDLIAARLEVGGTILFEAEVRSVEGITSDMASGAPVVRYEHEGEVRELACDLVAGCDGFHGVARDAIPPGVLRTYERIYPFGWLGILAQVAPSSDELIYAAHDEGFALHSMRSPTVTRLYLQCDPHDDIENWPDERIWEHLHRRLERRGGWELQEGPILEKGITAMRSFVTEPMQHGRLFLAGDAAHIVPPTGAKGLNLAVADVSILADAMAAYLTTGDERGLAGYSARCLRRVWRTQHFSWWMTDMLHRFADDDDGYKRKLQLSQLEYLTTSEAAATTLAENYVGLPMESAFLG